MNHKYLIKNGLLVNEGKVFEGDLLIANGIIEKIGDNLSDAAAQVLDVQGDFVIPGVIDDQVHFREPGLTHKANIFTESRAAVAGGTTSFMEMPNTVPNVLNQALLADKYQIAAQSSLANYSFFMGTSNDNYDELMKTDLKNVCGLKIFMGSSTGNMLVDNEHVLAKIFANFPGLIATHCEDEQTVLKNNEHYKAIYAESEPPYDIHAIIRDEQACYLSSSMAVALAQKHGTRLHILHLSSSEELALFDNSIKLADKKITSEVCVHHLWFDAEDYRVYGNNIKCNPAIKHNHRENLLAALLDNRLDIIATDHAPHLADEKSKNYWNAPSGLPLVQHSLQMMMDFRSQGKISMERIVEKMCHAPAECFNINRRGYLREGYHADVVVLKADQAYSVSKENILYKCGWSPLEGHTFNSAVQNTFVSGKMVYDNGKIIEAGFGSRLSFDV